MKICNLHSFFIANLEFKAIFTGVIDLITILTTFNKLIISSSLVSCLQNVFIARIVG